MLSGLTIDLTVMCLIIVHNQIMYVKQGQELKGFSVVRVVVHYWL